VIFAAAAREVLPDLRHGGSLWAVAIGGAMGIALMLALKRVEERVGGAVGLLALAGSIS